MADPPGAPSWDEIEAEFGAEAVQVRVHFDYGVDELQRDFQALPRDVQSILSQNAQAEYAKKAARYSNAAQKTAAGLKSVIDAHRNRAGDKEVGNAYIQLITGMIVAVPSPAGQIAAAVGGIANTFLGGGQDSALRAALGAIQRMLNEAVRQLERHIDEKFKENRFQEKIDKIVGSTGLCDMLTQISNKSQQIREGYNDRNVKNMMKSLMRSFELANNDIQQAMSDLVNYNRRFDNFETPSLKVVLKATKSHAKKLWAEHSIITAPRLNCDRLEKSIEATTKLFVAVSAAYRAVAWSLSHVADYQGNAEQVLEYARIVMDKEEPMLREAAIQLHKRARERHFSLKIYSYEEDLVEVKGLDHPFAEYILSIKMWNHIQEDHRRLEKAKEHPAIRARLHELQTQRVQEARNDHLREQRQQLELAQLRVRFMQEQHPRVITPGAVIPPGAVNIRSASNPRLVLHLAEDQRQAGSYIFIDEIVGETGAPNQRWQFVGPHPVEIPSGPGAGSLTPIYEVPRKMCLAADEAWYIAGGVNTSIRENISLQDAEHATDFIFCADGRIRLANNREFCLQAAFLKFAFAEVDFAGTNAIINAINVDQFVKLMGRPCLQAGDPVSLSPLDLQEPNQLWIVTSAEPTEAAGGY